MDAVGIGVAVNLSGGTTTHAHGQPSALRADEEARRQPLPGALPRVHEPRLRRLGPPDFAAQAVAQVEEGARLGAAGFKEFKRLGLFLRDKKSAALHIDDPKLDPMWQAPGRARDARLDPRRRPEGVLGARTTRRNERWKELKDHPRWWFGDPQASTRRARSSSAALERVVARHPETTFVCVHFGNNAEDLDWVDAQLDRHPNMMVDIAARVPEIGRHDPEQGARLLREARRSHPLRHRLPGLRPHDPRLGRQRPAPDRGRRASTSSRSTGASSRRPTGTSRT